jgi:ribokinase
MIEADVVVVGSLNHDITVEAERRPAGGETVLGRSPATASGGAAGVDTRHVRALDGAPSGTALIVVDDAGENSIVVVPGANAHLTAADVDGAQAP